MTKLILSLLLPMLLGAQLKPVSFSLPKTLVDTTLSYNVDTTSYSGLAGNSILDVEPAGDSLLFFGTSRGLALTSDLGLTFRSYLADSVDLPQGGISALLVSDSLIITAALKDTQTALGLFSMGTGLSFSQDTGNTWIYLAQSVETDTVKYGTISWGDSTIKHLSVTTPINNITYDVGYSLGNIWTTNWAGGLRRYNIADDKWYIVPLPGDSDTTLACDDIPSGYEINPLDPDDGGSHNHKGFSVIAYDSLIWVGTSAGINKGIVDSVTGCIEWTHYTSRWNGLTGNWVLGLYHQVAPGIDRIWAATMNTTDPLEKRGVSYTEDGGRTWMTTLIGERIDNFASHGSTIYAASSSGLFMSDDGQNWAKFQSAEDAITGEQVWAEEVYGVHYDTRDSTLWIATPDGLAHTSDNGVNWTIERAFVSTTASGEDRFYAYPNPFYMSVHNVRDGAGHLRLQYHITDGEIGAIAAITIFNFSMHQVAEIPSRVHSIAGDFSQVWDGRTDNGFDVANGVYYCRLTIGGADFWTKVIVFK